MGLRAPRVVYLVPAGQDWTFNAPLALSEVTRLWGGAGFVVVPVSAAEVHPALLAALRAYDPDHVVVPDATSPVGSRPPTGQHRMARRQRFLLRVRTTVPP